jgi:hypothetical protein
VGLYHRIQVTLLFVQKVEQDLPRTFDHFQLTVRLHLAHEMDHLGHYYPNLMPLGIEFCYDD